MSASRLSRRGFLRGKPLEIRVEVEAEPSPWQARRRAALAAAVAPREARLLAFECIAGTSFCSTCVERCPVPGALTMVDGLPRVDVARCDGCGACEEACPAPRKAIVVIPSMGRR